MPDDADLIGQSANSIISRQEAEIDLLRELLRDHQYRQSSMWMAIATTIGFVVGVFACTVLSH